MRSTRRADIARTLRSIGRALACVAVASLLAACPGRPPGPRWRGDGARTPKRGGTFYFSHEADVRSLDPQVAYDELSGMAVKLLFEGLLDYDYQTRLVPRLAEALPSVSEDGKTFRFRLRQGVKFHNGREVVADDVRWSMERMLAKTTNSPGFVYYSLLAGVDDYREGRAPHVAGIHVLDRYTIEFTLTQPDQTFLNAMAMTFAYPVPRENYARWGKDDVAFHPVGTGAYELEQWEQGVRIVFRRNPRFFLRGQPYPDRAVFELNLSREAAFMRFMNGDIDHAHRFTPADYLFLKRRAPAWRPYFVERPVINLWGLCMNTELPPFDNVHVRRAVALAVDRQRWNQARSFRLRVTGQPVPPGLLGYDENLPGLQVTDLARAREEMRLAGYPNGWPHPVTMALSEGATGKAYGELAQADLAKIGINVELRAMSFPVYLEQTGRRRTTQIAFSGWSMDFPDPSNFLDILFHTRSIHEADSENKSFYSNPELDRLLDAARIERDITRRGEMYRQAQQILVRDAPWAFMWNDLKLEAWQPYVRGFQPHPVWDQMFRDLWLDLPRHRVTSWSNPGAAPQLSALFPFGGGR